MTKTKTIKPEVLVIPDKDCPRGIEITKEEILKRAERIKPVVRFSIDEKGKLHRNDLAMIRSRVTDDGKTFEYKGEPYYKFDGLYYIKPVNLFNTAFTWDPKPTEKVNGELVHFDDIVTHHAYATSALFKPAQAEVLAQIPEAYLGKVVAFETVPLTETGYAIDALMHGCHVAHTRLYIDRKTDEADFHEWLKDSRRRHGMYVARPSPKLL